MAYNNRTKRIKADAERQTAKQNVGSDSSQHQQQSEQRVLQQNHPESGHPEAYKFRHLKFCLDVRFRGQSGPHFDAPGGLLLAVISIDRRNTLS